MNKKALVVFLIALVVTGVIGYGVSYAAREETSAPENVVAPHTVTDAEIGTAAKCLVCSADVTVAATTPALEYGGNVYYFDLPDCATAFAGDPNGYITTPEK